MDSEIKSFIKVWISALIALTYCYYIPSNLHKGKTRLLSLSPIFSLFIYLPLNLTTISLGGGTAFFLTWLANFKLILYAFDQGPLSSPSTSSKISLSNFISIACLPIKLKNNDTLSPQNKNIPAKSAKSLLNWAIKGLLLALLSLVWEHREHIHPKVMLTYLSCYIYIGLEVFLAIFAAIASVLLGFQLEPQFDEPYLSTSVQDFWGRRWNLMSISMKYLGKKWAPFLALFATFIVSGLVHELIFFYLGRVTPTWEVTWFFVIQGVCVAAEIFVKKEVKSRWRLHPVVSVPLSVGFVMFTGFWLFFPQLLRCNTDMRASKEVGASLIFLKDAGLSLLSMGVSSLGSI
ncbi:hypothetical protein GIB67_021286 [Kingdonia uniflora]|uniref:Wax synthase domain-containing protein n=1 Tax=Kingdonia uniflora TaxID=39325 RepID=A0A7J7LG13_9MAGN|nr:hypothetical protein GIB67_021286 [Kingdonia uniflora]